MTGYADAEELIGDWIFEALGRKRRVWWDPGFPSNWPFTAPLIKVQRAVSFGAVAVSLDNPTLDIDVYAAVNDHAREVAADVCSLMEFTLPTTTLPGGIFVKRVVVSMRPVWTPDPKARRSAAYEVLLHGFAN